jgi:hypothetical protein
MRIPPLNESTTGVESVCIVPVAYEAEQYSSRISRVLEAAWGELRQIEPDLPQVVLLVLSAREYCRRGHFTMEAWRKRYEHQLLHEVAVHPGMFESPADLLVTIIHEAAHAILWENRKDGDRHCCGVSLGGYYHRAEFRSAALQLGLEPHFLNRRYGFSLTTWPTDGVPTRYQGVLGTLGQLAVVASKQLPPRVRPPDRKKPISGQLLGCKCSPIRILRVSQHQVQRGPIMCGVCGVPFLPGA